MAGLHVIGQRTALACAAIGVGSMLHACAADADETGGTPWSRTVCIEVPVTTAEAAALAATMPTTPYPLQRRSYGPFRSDGWADARDRLDDGRGWIRPQEPEPIPDVPLPTSAWMLVAAFMALLGGAIIRRFG